MTKEEKKETAHLHHCTVNTWHHSTEVRHGHHTQEGSGHYLCKGKKGKSY